MAYPDYQDANQQGSTRDELDLVLDAALAKYAAVEPRAGLQERVLASLRAEQRKPQDHRWWRWGTAAALAAVVVVAIAVALRSGKPAPVAVHQSPLPVESPRAPETQVVHREGNSVAPRRPTHKAAATDAHSPEIVAAATPKLDVFPSPQPLSEQEKMLESFVKRYPREAVLTAEIRMEALRRDAEERRAIAAEDQKSQQ